MIWGWLSSDDMSEEERHKQNSMLKEGVQPEGVWEDWGDYEHDYREEPTQEDVKASSREEVETYYDELRPSGWWIFGGRNDSD